MATKPGTKRSSTSARAKAPAVGTKQKALTKTANGKRIQRPVKKTGAASSKTTKAKRAQSAAPAKPAAAEKAAQRGVKSQRVKKPAKQGALTGKRQSSGPKLGDKAPVFELMDQSGKTVSSRSLTGKPYVLYFYPRDNTPGCTNEACAFRDSHPNFSKLGVRVFGVSADSVKSHMGFVEKYKLPFTLLADPEKQLISAYGSWVLKQNYGREYMGIERSTFLIDKQGKVAHTWRGVKVNGHADAVLDAARKLG